MFPINHARPSFRRAVAIVTVTLLCEAISWAQPAPNPVAPPPPFPDAGAGAVPPPPGLAQLRPIPGQAGAAVVSGSVLRWLTNPDGDVDGLLLSDGTQVNFPPHLSSRVVVAIKANDAVQVVGWRDGAVFRAQTITAVASGQTVRDDGPPAEPPLTRDPAPLRAMSTTGRVETLLHGPRGEINGVVLRNGVLVRFPPHVGMQYAALFQPGALLSARGYGTRGSHGTAFEATALGNSPTSLQEVFTAPAPPAPPVPAAPPLARPGF